MVNGILTALLLAAFLGGAFWLYVMRRASDFDRLARMALDDETPEDLP